MMTSDKWVVQYQVLLNEINIVLSSYRYFINQYIYSVNIIWIKYIFIYSCITK